MTYTLSSLSLRGTRNLAPQILLHSLIFHPINPLIFHPDLSLCRPLRLRFRSPSSRTEPHHSRNRAHSLAGRSVRLGGHVLSLSEVSRCRRGDCSGEVGRDVFWCLSNSRGLNCGRFLALAIVNRLGRAGGEGPARGGCLLSGSVWQMWMSMQPQTYILLLETGIRGAGAWLCA